MAGRRAGGGGGPGAAGPRRRAGRSRGASPLPTRPPSARCDISCPPALLQRRFEEIRVPRMSRGAGPGGGGGYRRGTLDAGPREETWSGPRTRAPARSETPQGLARSPPGLRLSGASSSPPQPRGPPLPSPSAPFIFPRLRLGFCWFLGDKNRLKQRRRAARTNRAGRAMCAWLPAPAGSPGRGGGPSSQRPGSRAASQSGGPMSEVSDSSPGAASVSRPGRRGLVATSR